MFSAWLKGPQDDSLEGRKKRLIDEALTPEERAARRAEIADIRASDQGRGELQRSMSRTPAARKKTTPVVPQSAPEQEMQQTPQVVGDQQQDVQTAAPQVRQRTPYGGAPILEKLRGLRAGEGGFNIRQFAGTNRIEEATQIIDEITEDGRITREELQQLSGVNFQNPNLSSLNDAIALHFAKDRLGIYDEHAAEDSAIPDYARYDSPLDLNGVDNDGNIDLDNPESVQELFDHSQKFRDQRIKRSRIQLPQEIDGMMKRFEGDNKKLLKKENSQEFLDYSRPNRGKITEDHIDSFIGGMSNAEIAALGNMGIGGAGGRAGLFSKEDKQKRARGVVKVYLEQGGRDAYTGLPMSIHDMTVDHLVSEGDKKYHEKMGKEHGMSAKEFANSYDHNYVLTRYGLNERQKKENDLEKFHAAMEKKAKKGKEANIKELTGSSAQAAKKELMQEVYYDQILGHLKELVKSGKMDAATYNEIFDTYQDGREEIEGRLKRSEKKPHLYNNNNTNAMVDVFRTLQDGSLGGLRNYASDGIREKAEGQLAPWYGVAAGTTSPSNAPKTQGPDKSYPKDRRPSYVNEDTALDHYKDSLYRLKFSGKESMVQQFHQLTQLLGTAFATGNMGHQEYADAIKKIAQVAHDQVRGSDWDSEFDEDRADQYAKILEMGLKGNNLIHHTEEGAGHFVPNRKISDLIGDKQHTRRAAIDDSIYSILNEELGLDKLLGRQGMMEDFTDAVHSFIMEGKIYLS